MTDRPDHRALDTVRRSFRSVTKGLQVLGDEGAHGLAQRLARRAYRTFGAEALEEPLLQGDVADSSALTLANPERRPKRGTPLTIGWVTAPPALGSGGHTTMFRMVEALEGAGHRCRIFLYDRYTGRAGDHAGTISTGWPGIQAEVVDARHGITDVDGCVATSWDTAHVLARYGAAPMRRFYFIQDFEPFFYPRGAEYALAEDTYRFGFRNIALGRMVGDLLQSELGIRSDVTEFGCDTSVYRRLKLGKREGVVFYVRPGVARRGYWLGRLALAEFHQRHPEVPIHIYGDNPKDLPFPVERHGRIPPIELNKLYNSCVAGIAMSFTNISLVAEEMLAAGTIPVVNDSDMARADLSNEFVAWSRPTPSSVADALAGTLLGDRDAAARNAAGSVRQWGWGPAQRDVVRIVEDEVYGA